MKNKFAKNVKTFRIEKKLTQNQFAAVLGVTQRKISYWETGRIEPDIDTLWQIAEFFEISIDELVGKE